MHFLSRKLDAFTRDDGFTSKVGSGLLRLIESGKHDALWQLVYDSAISYIDGEDSDALVSKLGSELRKSALSYLPQLRKTVESPKAATFFAKYLKRLFDEFTDPADIGQKIQGALDHGFHNPVLEYLFDNLRTLVREGAMLRLLREELEEFLEDFKKDSSWVAKPFVSFFTWLRFRGEKKDRVVQLLIDRIDGRLKEAQEDPNDDLRKSLADRISTFADGLVSGNPTVLGVYGRIRQVLIGGKADQLAVGLLNNLLDMLKESIESDETATSWFDFNSVAGAIAKRAVDWIKKARNDPKGTDNLFNRLRAKVDAEMRRFVEALAAGEPEAKASLAKVMHHIVNNAEDVLRPVLDRAHKWCLAQIKDARSGVWQKMHELLASLQTQVFSEAKKEERARRLLRCNAKRVFTKYQPQIGKMIKNRLEKFDNAKLVQIVDDKFGNDLQFVRLNGAVLGFMIGVVLAALLFGMSRVMQ